MIKIIGNHILMFADVKMSTHLSFSVLSACLDFPISSKSSILVDPSTVPRCFKRFRCRKSSWDTNTHYFASADARRALKGWTEGRCMHVQLQTLLIRESLLSALIHSKPFFKYPMKPARLKPLYILFLILVPNCALHFKCFFAGTRTGWENMGQRWGC